MNVIKKIDNGGIKNMSEEQILLLVEEIKKLKAEIKPLNKQLNNAKKEIRKLALENGKPKNFKNEKD